MKKLAAIILFLGLGVFSIQAQSNWKSGKNELNIGIKPFKLGATSLQYKAKLSKRNWLRAGLTDLTFRDGSSGLRVGLEKQRNLLLRTRLIYGIEPGIYADYDRIDDAISSYNVDLGFPVGVQVHLTKRLLLGFEARPHIEVYESYIPDDGSIRIEGFSGGVDFFNGIKTTLGYRF